MTQVRDVQLTVMTHS